VDFGAKGDGKTDNQAAILKAIDYAKANGKEVFIPEGTFLHSGALTLNGVKMFGGGEGSVLKATTYGNEAVVLKGDGAGVSDLHLIGFGKPDGTARHPALTSCAVLVDNATNFTIENVHAEQTSGAGFFILTGSKGHVADNVVEHTKADSIHMTHASHDIVVERNKIMYSADDSIAVVSYGGAGDTPVSNITIRDNEILYNTWGRGITVAGGNNVLVEHNSVTGGTADRAGIYIASGEYNTQAVHNVRVSGNTIVDGGGSVSGHGAITVYNPGGLVIDTLTIANNDIINPRKAGILVAGGGLQSMLIYDNQLTGGRHGLLGNIAANATISTASPAGQTTIIGVEGAPRRLNR
jgi:polygalacturonase